MAGTHERIIETLRTTAAPVEFPAYVWVVAGPGGFREATTHLKNARIIAGHVEGARIVRYQIERMEP